MEFNKEEAKKKKAQIAFKLHECKKCKCTFQGKPSCDCTTNMEGANKGEKTNEIYHYKCGHGSHGVLILDCNEPSMLGYFDWAETVGVNGDMSKCWECYCKEDSDNAEKTSEVEDE